MNGIVLTHGAGSNADAPLLVALAKAFEAAGWRAVRHTLAFRLRGGSPHPSRSGEDRAGIAQAVAEMRAAVDGDVCVGGHSYGGRQASMLAAEEPGLIDALLLMSYPLHPPAKPQQLRTEHFPKLETPALFVHGVRDTFATSDELAAAVKTIPAAHRIISLEKAGHELKGLDPAKIVKEFAAYGKLFK